MKKTMKAAVLHKIGDKLRIEQVPIPTPGRGDVLIKVTACGVCHSDLHAIDGDWQPLPTLPLIPGHEVAGHVAALGEGVTDLKVGDRRRRAVDVQRLRQMRVLHGRHGDHLQGAARPAATPSPAAMPNTWWRTPPSSRACPRTPTSTSWRRSCAPASPPIAA